MDMQHQAMGYDRTATMFSPEGTILQVEYAQKTVRLGSSSVGGICSDGVFIVTDKRMKDKLMMEQSSYKISEIDSHIIASSSGIVSDARVLIEKAQVISQQHRVTYDSPIEPEIVIKELSNMKQQFTQYGGARPFGVSLMLAGIRDGRPELYTSDVTGNYFAYHANAIGESDDKIKGSLREKYDSSKSLKQNVKLVLEILKEVHDKTFDNNRLELVYIKNEEGKIKRLVKEELANFLK